MPASSSLNGAGRSPSPGGLTFRPPTPETEDPLTELAPDLTAGEDLGSPSPSLSSSPPDGSPSDSEWSSAGSDEDAASDPTSSRSGDDRGGRVSAVSRKAQQAAARKAVKMAGAMAHQYLARDEAARAVGLYLVDDDTAAAIADPLARIAARRMPAESAVNNPDVADGLAAMMGLADFVRQSIELQSRAAAIRAGQEPEQIDAQDVGAF